MYVHNAPRFIVPWLWQNGRVILKRTTSSTKQIQRKSIIKVHILQNPRLFIGRLLILFLIKCSIAWLQSARGISTFLNFRLLNTSFLLSPTFKTQVSSAFLSNCSSPHLQVQRSRRTRLSFYLEMAPLPAWRSTSPVIIYPRIRPKQPSFKTWAPHVLKALLVVGLVLIWIITTRPDWFSGSAGEFTIEKAVDLGLVGIIQK
jgi:hypothetical protein